MNILVSNDDGVLAPGLRILIEALSEIATVSVVAPDRNQSAASNSLTIMRPLRAKQLQERVFSVDGTPTDCVHMAITGLLSQRPDMVISGINEGSNLGDDILYSGTVAAAMEGRFLGFPAMAVSIVNGEVKQYQTASIITKNLVMKLINDPLPTNTILNVNVPNVLFKDLKGMEVTRLGTRHSAERLIKDSDPYGRAIYWIGPSGPEQDAGPGTDFYALNNNYVSITPLHIDLTHYSAFDQLARWVDRIELV